MDNNFEKLNIHDPHNEYVWADTTPAWVTVLKVAGFIAGGIGLFAVFSLFTIIMFQIN
tara:strand:- start:55 stop:228 length:174 start_codon:yes stop_codon:yes gene_type:complete